MTLAYILERSWRSIEILCTNPEHLRNRLPYAWDEGQSQIDADELPPECAKARQGLEILNRELARKTDSYFAREFGAAWASAHRRHSTTLQRLAEQMLQVHVDLESYEEVKAKGRTND